MTPDNINTPEYWNRVYRGEWESGQVGSPDYERNYGPIHDAVLRLIGDGARVLDVACGPGLLCRKIKLQLPSSRVLGVDFSEYIIARNQERDAALGIEYRSLDIRTSLRLVNGQFDVVTMCEILEHLENPEAAVRASMALLKPGGKFVLTCPHDGGIPDPEHLRQWGHDDLFHLLAPYSDTVSFVHFPPPCFHAWMLAYLVKTRTDSGNESAS
jgi:2-polyprenyl-3-methyl-5-hydroxy-6-metoxy-1,4-benzoquinol methylase